MYDPVLASSEAFQIDPALALFQDERIPEILTRRAQIALPEAHVVVKQLRVICSLRRGDHEGDPETCYDPVSVIVADEPAGNVKAILLPALCKCAEDQIAVYDLVFCDCGSIVR